jgi:hypothetical protein
MNIGLDELTGSGSRDSAATIAACTGGTLWR